MRLFRLLLVDAALLPVWPGDRLEVRYGGQSAALSSGAMGGSVLLEPDWSMRPGWSGFLGLNAGSFGRKEGQAGLGFSREKISARARAGWQEADNDFPFQNTTRIGRPLVRQANNRVERFDVQQFNRLEFNEKNSLKTAFWHQRAFRRIPPAMTEAPSDTWQRDRATRITADWAQRPGHRTQWLTRAAWTDESVFFRLAGDTDSSRTRTALLSSEYSAAAGHDLLWKAGGNAIRQWARADGYADSAAWYAQNRLAGFGMLEYRLPRGRLTALLRQEWLEGRAVPFTWSLGGQVDWGRAGALRFHLSRNFNLPTFNDRFWLEYGRPDLKAERGYGGEVGWILATLDSTDQRENTIRFSLEVSAFHLLLDDWILWQPGPDGIFRPGNLRRVWSRGVEAGGNWKLDIGNWKLKVSARYQLARTTNVAVYDGLASVLDKQLPYTPNHSAGGSLKIRRGPWAIAYLHQWTGRRFTTSDNLERLNSFNIGNLLAQWNFRARFFPKQITGAGIDLRLENIWNSPYQVIAYRPMPGFSWRLGFSLHF